MEPTHPNRAPALGRDAYSTRVRNLVGPVRGDPRFIPLLTPRIPLLPPCTNGIQTLTTYHLFAPSICPTIPSTHHIKRGNQKKARQPAHTRREGAALDSSLASSLRESATLRTLSSKSSSTSISTSTSTSTLTSTSTSTATAMTTTSAAKIVDIPSIKNIMTHTVIHLSGPPPFAPISDSTLSPISDVTSPLMFDRIAACDDFWAAEEYRPGRPTRIRLEAKDVQMLGISTSENELASFVTFESSPKEIFIIHAFTNPRWRSKGLCMQLIDALKQQGKAEGQHLYLETTQHSRTFWTRRCGFFRANRSFSPHICRHHLVFLNFRDSGEFI